MTSTLTPDDLDTIKARQQATWASGDYAVIGTTLQIVGESLCEAVDVTAGSQVLDVAAGNGNASLAAARRGCAVTATDYVEALLDGAQRRADAEGLPLDDPRRRRREPALRRRLLRHRAVDLRRDVRPRTPTARRRR